MIVLPKILARWARPAQHQNQHQKKRKSQKPTCIRPLFPKWSRGGKNIKILVKEIGTGNCTREGQTSIPTTILHQYFCPFRRAQILAHINFVSIFSVALWCGSGSAQPGRRNTDSNLESIILSSLVGPKWAPHQFCTNVSECVFEVIWNGPTEPHQFWDNPCIIFLHWYWQPQKAAATISFIARFNRGDNLWILAEARRTKAADAPKQKNIKKLVKKKRGVINFGGPLRKTRAAAHQKKQEAVKNQMTLWFPRFAGNARL